MSDMSEPANQTMMLQRKLDEIRAGDGAAAEALMAHAYERLRRLSRKMLMNFPAVRRWEQTDDVLQDAALRLHKSVREVQPDTVRAFFGLAALQIRRTLIDLARHHMGPEGRGAHHATMAGGGGDDGQTRGDFTARQPGDEDGPLTLMQWCEFHERAGKLPEEEREVFDQLWYHGLSQGEAAQVLGVSLRTVNRRWQSARLMLYEALGGHSPEG